MHTNDVSSGEEPNTNKPGQVRRLHREGNGSCTSRQILKGHRVERSRSLVISGKMQSLYLAMRRRISESYFYVFLFMDQFSCCTHHTNQVNTPGLVS